MHKIIIAIDGWSSCGKSTLAKQLATTLNYIYIDTGAMYRAITLYFIRHNVPLDDDAAVANALQNIELVFEQQANGKAEIKLNGELVEFLIRDLLVAEKVSEVAAIKAVREFAVAAQQQMGRQKGVVMDGRDIGTTVFPNAEIKFFMTAEKETRVNRRFAELQLKNPHITIEEVRQNLAMRDHIDSTRAISPLRQAEDAIVLDNTHLTEKEQLLLALDHIAPLVN